MNGSRNAKLILVIFMLFAAILACGLPGSSDDTPVPESPAAPTNTSAPNATPVPTVVHTDVPTEPGDVNSFVNDRSTKSISAERRANADNFAINLLERPYSSEVMDYLDYLDITKGELSLVEPWLYVTIKLEGSPAEGAQVFYGLEIDTDVDGRGDLLVYGLVPSSTDWTTDGVHVYMDSNNDNGSLTPVFSDPPDANVDGYDDEIFSQGQGDDPDTAWIRRDPNNANHIQLAVKWSVVDDGAFLWGVWADEGVHEAGFFDYNDHYTLAEAGSPVSNSVDYPVKALHSIDNSCRWSFGFTASGNEPGLCFIPPTPTPTPVPATRVPPPTPTKVPTATPIPPGSIWGLVCKVPGEGTACTTSWGWSGRTVTLGKGACSSSGAGSDTTDSAGKYTFSNLTPGNYCVTSTQAPPSCGWAYTALKQTVTVKAGQTTKVPNIIYVETVC